MNISYILLIGLATVCGIFLICTLYFFIYKRHINKILVEPEKKHLKLIPPYKVLLVLLIILAITGTSFVVTILPNMERLSTVSDIERDVRDDQKIAQDWNIEIAMDSKLAVVIAFDNQNSDHTFAIYENSSGNSNANFVFRYGGKSTSIERSVRVFTFENTIALVSMNTLHIAAIECHDGERYEVDANSPFAIVIPSGGFDVYDNNGKLISLAQDEWYEVSELK